MTTTTRAVTLAPVTTTGDDIETRGAVIRRRMQALGMKATDLAAAADSNRSLLYRVFRDEPSVREESYRTFENALERIEREHGHPAGPDAVLPTEGGLIEFEVTGDFGVRVVVKGPVENAEELEASVARLIRDIRANPED